MMSVDGVSKWVNSKWLTDDTRPCHESGKLDCNWVYRLSNGSQGRRRWPIEVRSEEMLREFEGQVNSLIRNFLFNITKNLIPFSRDLILVMGCRNDYPSLKWRTLLVYKDRFRWYFFTGFWHRIKPFLLVFRWTSPFLWINREWYT